MDPPGTVRLGAMWIHVPDSEIVTRDGLDVYDFRARVHPIWASPNFWLEAEYAWQTKNNVAANGWLLQANYNAQDLAWKPLFDFRYASLSGDRPETAKWEGFDPLYFGGSNPNWYQGQIGSTIFNNTNINVASAGVTLTPDENNIVVLRYLYFAADRDELAARRFPLPASRRPSVAACRQVARERVRLLVDLHHRQAAQRQRLRRVRGARLGLQGSVCGERRQRPGLVVLRRAVQFQLLNRRRTGSSTMTSLPYRMNFARGDGRAGLWFRSRHWPTARPSSAPRSSPGPLGVLAEVRGLPRRAAAGRRRAGAQGHRRSSRNGTARR